MKLNELSKMRTWNNVLILSWFYTSIFFFKINFKLVHLQVFSNLIKFGNSKKFVQKFSFYWVLFNFVSIILNLLILLVSILNYGTFTYFVKINFERILISFYSFIKFVNFVPFSANKYELLIIFKKYFCVDSFWSGFIIIYTV